MDADEEAGEVGVMILSADYSDEARALWDAATALNRAAAAVSPSAAGLPPLLFFTDPERTHRPWETAARLPAGSAVVYRAFGADDAAETGAKLRRATRDAGVKLLVGRDLALAEAVEADGLHLPEREAGRAVLVRRAHPDWRLTAAWHGGDHPAEGLDALVLSPIFPAGGASAVKPPLGVDGFRRCADAADLPVYALGGVDAGTAQDLIGSGACGLAGVAAIQSAFR
jgi:thiamine-phosphate pyrophosphorylase